ncbi:arsenate reductase family protein [Enterococcus mediterraneensis]|uniref:arsenate reductase family protein n=1 Tax=Enterococcus mediterraneensis TaxID=2364791 RepID=UPI000F06C65B|nr:arsenate reductase family protein [Enterococcus mediterraneensis]
MLTFYWYPKCSTCKKAKAWLDAREVSYELVDMIQHPPAAETLENWMTESDLPIRRFFNTSGMRYRELGLKDQVADFTFQEASRLLATDGMLIKRPILEKNGKIQAIGFKENDFEGAINEL